MNNRAQSKPGDFSLGQAHEFARAFGRKGGNPDLLQQAIDDLGLMERLVRYMQSGGFAPTTNQKLAKAILPTSHFFGVEEWLTHFGGRVKFTKTQLAKVSELPWSEEELKNPGLKQPEFVFLVPPRIDGKPLTLRNLHEVFPKRNHPKFYWTWYLNEDQPFADEEVPFGWYSVVVGTVKGSTSLSYERQLALIPDGYENPIASVVAMAEPLFYLLNGKYMNTNYWARTKTTTKSGRRVSVGARSGDGVDVYGWYGDALSRIGVAASRKILDS
ncbi:hypothetical protein HY502_00355 [Candidatus Woesebacteria bacterium]|nr:hypothetical protein [Candidatus Woesebacteria bacterium]